MLISLDKLILYQHDRIMGKGENAGYLHFTISHNNLKSPILNVSQTSPDFNVSVVQIF